MQRHIIRIQKRLCVKEIRTADHGDSTVGLICDLYVTLTGQHSRCHQISLLGGVVLKHGF